MLKGRRGKGKGGEEEGKLELMVCLSALLYI